MSKNRYRNLDNLFDIAVNTTAYWSKIDASAGPQACWPWNGPSHRQGYGFIGARRYADDIRIMVVAHRVGMRIKLGRAIDSKEMVVHSCSNMACQNPDHLMLGDASLRTRTMYANGRNTPLPTGKHSRDHRPQAGRQYKRTIEEMLFIKHNRPKDIAARFGIDIKKACAWRAGIREGYAWLRAYEDK
jgi:hypothetical protein